MMSPLAQAITSDTADPTAGSVVAAAGEFAGLGTVMAPYMGVFFIAFFVVLVLTPIMRRLAIRNGVVDWPDPKRKNHLQPVAYLGGVAIFLGWLAGVTFCYFIEPHGNGSALGGTKYINFPLSIILGAMVVTLTGLFDDVYRISPHVKVGGQFFAAAALANEAVGLQLVQSSIDIIGLPEPAGWVIYVLGTGVIAFFVVGGCNAMNLLDGMDGLATGVTAIAATGFLIIAGIIALRATADAEFAAHGDPVRIVMCLAIIGAALGFLPYNFNPATIFMGDAGSLLLGYLCVTTILLFSGTRHGLIVVTAALVVFILPIADTSLAIFRRKMQGKPVFLPDDQHIHHLLRHAGLSAKQAVFALYSLATFFAAVGVFLVWSGQRWRFILAVLVALYGLVTVTAYKYGQFQQFRGQRHKEQQVVPSMQANRANRPLPRVAEAEPVVSSSDLLDKPADLDEMSGEMSAAPPPDRPST